MQFVLRKLATGVQAALLSTLLMLVLCGGGGPLVVFNDARSSESEENAPSSERQEEFTTMGRCDFERLMKFEHRRLAAIFEVPASSRLGHTQNAVLLAPSGHRLANGLLAPITC